MLRLILIFALLLPSLARADTYAASPSYYGQTGYFSSVDAACADYGAYWISQGYGVSYSMLSASYCATKNASGAVIQGKDITQSGFMCPHGGTVSGTSCVNAPACTAPQVRNVTTGACEAPSDPCAASSGQTTSGWITINKGSDATGSFCQNGCGVTVAGDGSNSEYYYTDTTITRPYTFTQTGQTCTNQPSAPAPAPSNAQPNTPPKNPPCAAGEGVMTSTSGNVRCVPSGTPSSSTAKVDYEKFKKTFPDGSTQETTRTTTTDPATGAKSSSDSVTNSPATGGGQGQAGPVGTTTGSGTNGTTQSGSAAAGSTGEKTGFCAENPNLQICKGGLNEEATQKKIADGIKSLTDPTGVTYDAITSAKQSQKSDDDLAAENEKLTQAATGLTSPNDASKTAWQAAMTSDWFAGIPASTCSPLDAQIGGWSWHWDYCPTAQKISTIAEYGMWFMFVVGVFVMLTGGRKEA